MRAAGLALLLACSAFAPAAAAQEMGEAEAGEAGEPAGALSWTDLADLTLASPAIFRATAETVGRLSRRAAPDVPQGATRMLVAARIVAVLKAEGPVPGRAEWLWQGARPAAPARRVDLLVFASPAGGPGPASGPVPALGQYRLQTAWAQQPWSPEIEAQVRAILAEARAPGGVPAFRAFTGGFHVPGAVAGDSESQIFLDLGRPVTLVILRRAGAVPDVKIATGDLIDDSAEAVRPRTLLWRTLACETPEGLPAGVAVDPATRAALAADWAAARAAFGPCGRSAPGGSGRAAGAGAGG